MDVRFQSLARFRASYIEQAPAVKKVDKVIHRINPYPVDSAIGPLQASHSRGTNRRAGEQKSHWDKTNKENYNLELCMPFVCPSAASALQRGGFVPREWLAAKGLLVSLIPIHWIVNLSGG